MEAKLVLRGVVAALAGGLVGYALYRTVGCTTGACPLTANPYISVIYGMLAGLLLAQR